MKFKIGDIYLLDFYMMDSNKVVRRPYVIWNHNEQLRQVDVIPLVADLKENKMPTHIYISTTMGDSTRNFTILCEQLTTVGENAIDTKIGKINNNTISLIERVIPLMNAFSFPKKEKKISEIILEDKDKFDLLVQSVEDIKKMTKEANSVLNKWKERIFGFVFGILASIIATLLIYLIS
ncbi:MAG: type II toxin-antitoxin system PemK/MazF family toxin [Lachnotalea sp.]